MTPQELIIKLTAGRTVPTVAERTAKRISHKDTPRLSPKQWAWLHSVCMRQQSPFVYGSGSEVTVKMDGGKGVVYHIRRQYSGCAEIDVYASDEEMVSMRFGIEPKMVSTKNDDEYWQEVKAKRTKEAEELKAFLAEQADVPRYPCRSCRKLRARQPNTNCSDCLDAINAGDWGD